MSFKKIHFFALSLLLISCSSKDKITGDRKDIIVSDSALVISDIGVDVSLLAEKNVTEWTQPNLNSTNNVEALSFSVSPKKEWEFVSASESLNGNCVTTAPIFVNENVIFVDAGGVIHNINAKDGKERWATSTTVKGETGQAGAAIACSGDILLVSTSFSECIGISLKNGKVLWRKKLPAPCKGSAITIDSGFAYIICSDSSFHKLDPKNGKIIWSDKGVDAFVSYIGGPAPAICDKLLFIPTSSGELICVEKENGLRIWETNVSKFSSTEASSSIQHLRVSPVISGNMLYVISPTGTCVAFDSATGAKIWGQDAGGLSNLATSVNHIFVVDKNSNLVCINKRTGAVTWVKKIYTKEDIRSFSFKGFYKGFLHKQNIAHNEYFVFSNSSNIIVISPSGYIMYVSPKSGEIEKSISIGKRISVEPIIVDRAMYILCDDGTLLKYK